MEKIVLDTNILIEVLKGNENIISKLESENTNYCISSITVMELYYGAFNKAELKSLKAFIQLFEILNLNEKISEYSMQLIHTYAKSHNLGIPDSLIASTALIYDLPLYTLNKKDFKYIKNLNLF